MNDLEISSVPAALERIRLDTERLGFSMALEPRTGALLRMLAASKPGGRLLELGTGTGLGTAWLLSGMNSLAHLSSVDNDPKVLEIARLHLGHDRRVSFHLADGAVFLSEAAPQSYDFIFADSWPGKFTHLDEALALLRAGGIYFIDDLLPQPNWPEEHAPRVSFLIEDLERRPGFVAARLAWASGIMILVRTDAGCSPRES